MIRWFTTISFEWTQQLSRNHLCSKRNGQLCANVFSEFKKEHFMFLEISHAGGIGIIVSRVDTNQHARFSPTCTFPIFRVDSFGDIPGQVISLFGLSYLVVKKL